VDSQLRDREFRLNSHQNARREFNLQALSGSRKCNGRGVRLLGVSFRGLRGDDEALPVQMEIELK